MELRHERFRKRDAVLAFEEVEFPFPFRWKKKCQIANRRTSLSAHTSKIGEHSSLFFLLVLIWFFFSFFFSFVLFHVTRGYRVPVNRAPRKSVVTADRAYAHIARGSLWPSVTVYSFRSYFVPVALKKSQSIRDKYAYVPDDGDLPRYVMTVAGMLINICLRCFFFLTENKRVYIYGRSWFLPPALLSDLSIIIAHLMRFVNSSCEMCLKPKRYLLLFH